MKKNKLFSWLARWTSPPPDPSRNELRYWQERIIYSFLLIGMSFGALSTVQGVLLSFKEGFIGLAVTNIAFYVWVWILFFWRSLPYVVRVGSIIGYCYAIGLGLLIVTGPFGAGPSGLFCFPVATGLLLKSRHAFISLLINLLTIIGFGLLIMTGNYDWPFMHVQPLETWVVIGLHFLLLSTLVTVSIVLISQGLQASLLERNSALAVLKVRNEDLEDANRRLREEIQAKEKARAERKEMEVEKQVVDKTNQAISDWVDFIAHEIRSHITGPLSFSQLGLRKLDAKRLEEVYSKAVGKLSDDESSTNQSSLTQLKKVLTLDIQKLVKYFQQIFNGFNRLRYLLNDLLDLSKLEAGHMPLKIKATDIQEVVKNTIDGMGAALSDKRLRLKTNYLDVDTIIDCDSFWIGQLMQNLLSNAIKFTPPETTIEIGFKQSVLAGNGQPDTTALTVTVADEGIGIPDDQVSEVFEKFKQSRKTRTGEGTGLGLPICREIVNAHGGHIWVESILQQGTHFHFSIPYKSVNTKGN